jgi:hypothetical protein
LSNYLSLSQLISSVKQGGNLSGNLFDSTDTLYKQELERLHNSNKSPLWPDNIHPNKMCDAFGALFATYDSVLGYFEIEKDFSVFKNLCHNLDKESSSELTKFLMNMTTQDLGLIANPSYMIMFLKMLRPLNLQPCMQLALQLTNHDWHVQNHFNFLMGPHYYQPIISLCMGMKSGSFVVKTGSLFESLTGPFQHIHVPTVGDVNQQQAVRKQIQDSFKEQLNQTFNVCGKQCYDIAEHGDLIDIQFAKWLNILYTLSKYEVKKWEKKGFLLETFQNQANWAKKTLKDSIADKKMYSGASVSPYTVSLIKTGQKEKSESLEFLNQVIDEHVESHKEELSAFDKVKNALPILGKAIELFDNLADSVKKAGRIS